MDPLSSGYNPYSFYFDEPEPKTDLGFSIPMDNDSRLADIEYACIPYFNEYALQELKILVHMTADQLRAYSGEELFQFYYQVKTLPEGFPIAERAQLFLELAAEKGFEAALFVLAKAATEKSERTRFYKQAIDLGCEWSQSIRNQGLEEWFLDGCQ